MDQRTNTWQKPWPWVNYDVDYYREVIPEDRKDELAQYQKDIKHEDERRLEELVLPRSMEKEVDVIYKALQKKTARDFDISGYFELYSTEHTKHFDNCASAYVEFYYIDLSVEPDPDKIHGHIYFNPQCRCSFEGFVPPRQVSLESYRLESTLESTFFSGGRHEVTFQFISDNHIKLRVPRDLVMMDDEVHAIGYGPILADVPDFFEFVGVRSYEERQRIRCLKRKREDKEERRQRRKRGASSESY